MQIAPKLKKAGWYGMKWLVHGRPDRVLIFYGGLGDQLMCSAVAHELRTRGIRKVWINSDHRELFLGNPDIAHVLPVDMWSFGYLCRLGIERTEVKYPIRNSETDSTPPTPGHVIATMCESVGITGPIALRPYLHLNESERARGRLTDRQIVIQSSGLGARLPMLNKDWYPERFQEVVTRLRGKFNFVQIGHASDPPLEGAADFRGKTSVRQTAAMMSNSLMFVGLEGFLVHLSRAVDCRSVVVLGGRTLPHHFGYSCNQTLTTQLPCSNCWKWNTCDYDRECMRQISTDRVIAAIELIASRQGQPLAVDTAEIGFGTDISSPMQPAMINK